MDIGVRAPNHLGDAVMALPTLLGGGALGRVTVYGPPWLSELGLVARPRGQMDRHDAAVLLAPSLRAAWEARACRRRVGIAGDTRRWLLTDVVAPRVHRADTYAAIAGVLGAVVSGPPCLAGEHVPDGHVALLPTCRGGPTRTWGHFRSLADAIDRPVVFYGAYDEAVALAQVAGPWPSQLVGLSGLRNALCRASVVVGNDSGGAHLARALGVPTVVIFGSTAPERTGPAGAWAVQRVLMCRPCEARTCPTQRECLDVTVAEVLATVQQAMRSVVA